MDAVEIVRAGSGQPELWVVAGVHGDEVEGMACVEEALSIVTPAVGTLVGVPVAHPAALRAGTRRGVDGRDLNRTYPGRCDGEPTERIAWDLWQAIRSGSPSALVTIHSWSRGGCAAPHVEHAVGDEVGRELAHSLNLPFVVPFAWPEGLLPRAAVEAGIPSVELELGGLGAQTSENLERGVAAVRAAAGWLGMVEKAGSARTARVVRRVDVPSPAPGRVRQLKTLGSEIDEAEPLFELRDHGGRVVESVVSPARGWVGVHVTYGWAGVGDTVVCVFEESG